MWQGKLIGGLIGMAAGPAGALIGAFLGHLYDVENEKQQAPRLATDPRSVQDTFFRATFQVMGHIAKADGRVSEEEIRAARAVMAQFRLSEPEVRLAIDLFTAGKSSSFPLNQAMQNLTAACAGRADLKVMFVQIQLQAALWSDGLNPHSRAVLQRVCGFMGIPEYQLAQMEAVLRAQYSPNQAHRSDQDTLQDAYRVLGVESSASDTEVTKAYRRLMNQNHPDKLVAKGLPESMMKLAEEKTRNIRAAYERICEVRGIK